ncbi:hypothetical protein ACHAXA_003195 [Cyclostephanos tholiformis]|uniref:L domain-like protein n=1 Tax=Cyclostephanos tholiformis TaxID=382380 RepID=A0ABD3RYF6_9STRA
MQPRTMGRRLIRTALVSLGAIASQSAAATKSDRGSLRRKRAGSASSLSQQQQQGVYASLPDNRRLTESSESTTGEIGNKSRRFFLPPSHEDLDYKDMRELILELNIDVSMSITIVPTPAPTISFMPTITDCASPDTCANRLLYQVNMISERVGTIEALADPMSPQSKARDWIIEECTAPTPIEYCGEMQLILNEQRYALAVMYFSLGGDEWNAGANPGIDKNADKGTWLSGLNYCDWGSEITTADGSYKQLECDEFGNVLFLNLQSNNMVGAIPPEIGVLVYLASYISFFNAQSGPIPSTLGLLKSLETFDVESNNMEGILFQPEYLGPDGLTNIVNFRASINNFGGTIPTDIGLWTKLQNLWFTDNEITGTLPSELGNLANLEAFLLYNNQITGSLPTELGNLDKLNWIDMENNEVVGVIPEEFYSNLALEKVILKNNSLTGTISELVGDLTMLKTFWVSFNELTGSIPTGFGNMAVLKELELQHNFFTGILPEEFGNLESIEFLSVEQNKLSGTIPSVIFGGNLQGLRILYLNNNQLTGPVPENYGMSPRLQDLWLSDNMLTGTLPVIAEGEFLFLEELLVENNDLTGTVDESICRILNTTGGNLGVLHADCQPPRGGGAPQIICNCCTACFE